MQGLGRDRGINPDDDPRFYFCREDLELLPLVGHSYSLIPNPCFYGIPIRAVVRLLT